MSHFDDGWLLDGVETKRVDLDTAALFATVFSTKHEPNPESAIDVLAFLFAPREAILSGCVTEAERNGTMLLIAEMHKEAAERWSFLTNIAARASYEASLN